jgi:hypothetical protein
VPETWTMNGNLTVERLYVELTALLIDREIARVRRGEQAALVGFANVAKLARNASRELMVPLARGRVGCPDAYPHASLHGPSL